ncbi:hypothetical protein [Rhodohalobacter sulfatireducens]|uniref:Uncharacterized protein n=1 Tax=Rhodohalobacter sulfatireducens TaxID=2911366 RepID=A0ABS9KDY9_9BACT|nr:hypothetical protein [Rhodohalobacter sulfatireducens]MCG2589076.1 hypothetical protein [Rhodohalobacter sulfatireducens]
MKQIFQGRETEAGKNLLIENLDQQTLDSIKQSYKEEKGSMLWGDLSDEIKSRASELLNIPLPDLLIRAWRESGVLNKYINREEYDPEAVVIIELKEHTMISNHKPYLDIEINQKSIGKINFEINLELIVQGIILKIQDAKIKQIRTGNIKASGTINCEGHEIGKKESEEVDFPGTLDLGEGIPIAP